MNLSDRLPIATANYPGSEKSMKFYKAYLELSAKYKELQRLGVVKPRESRLRSISDSPIPAPEYPRFFKRCGITVNIPTTVAESP